MWNVQGAKKKTLSPERLPGGYMSDQEMLGDAETEREKKAGLGWGVGHGMCGNCLQEDCQWLQMAGVWCGVGGGWGVGRRSYVWDEH